MHPVRIGTCGWAYKDWQGVFYPRGLAAAGQLPYYAERYPIVEVDSTFYASPALRTVQGWRDKTPDGFGFSLKVPQVITHEKVLNDCGKELDTFLTAARALEGKLLCCCLQFAYFNRKAFANLGAFLERLDPFLAAWPSDVPVAVEVRNAGWVGLPLLNCLRAQGAAFVLADQAWMVAPLDVVHRLDVVTGPFAYVRLLGDRAAVDAATGTLDHIVLDRSGQVRADALAIRELSGRVPVVAFVNNHFAGYAPQTVAELQAALGAAG
jgi:uncharacterized protein YecE (DUF72 family)